MFLRVIFVLFLFLLMMPDAPSESESVPTDRVFTATRDLVQDISKLCERNNEACGTGAAFADSLWRKFSFLITQIIAFASSGEDESGASLDTLSLQDHEIEQRSEDFEAA